MNAGKLKNLILLTLTCTVAVLLCIVVPQRLSRRQKLQAVGQELSRLFETYEVELSPQIIPESVNLYSVEAARTGYDMAAAALLGADSALEEAEMRYEAVYQGSGGTLSVSRNGSLQADLTNLEPKTHPDRMVRELLKQMNVQTGLLRTRKGQQETVIETELLLLGVPILGGDLCFTFSENALTAVEGSGFAGGGALTRVSQETCLSCADALRLLLASRDSLGWVGSCILSLQQAYLPTETAESTLRFVPVWLIETDTGTLLVNGISHEIRAIDQ